MSVCKKCSKQIKSNDLKTCSKCPSAFHYQCLGIPTENFGKESKTYKASWKCPDCKLGDNRVSTQSLLSKDHLQSPSSVDTAPSNNNEDLKKYIERLFEDQLSRLSRDLKRDFSAESADTRNKLQELTESIVFMSAKYDEVKADLTLKENRIKDLETENAGLKSEVSDLNRRLSYFEQQQRDCNLEIQCIPENKSENLNSIVQQLSATMGYHF